MAELDFDQDMSARSKIDILIHENEAVVRNELAYLYLPYIVRTCHDLVSPCDNHLLAKKKKPIYACNNQVVPSTCVKTLLHIWGQQEASISWCRRGGIITYERTSHSSNTKSLSIVHSPNVTNYNWFDTGNSSKDSKLI